MDSLLRFIRRNLHKLYFLNIYSKNKIILYGVPTYVKPKNIIFGENIIINDNVFLHAEHGIQLGNNVTLSYGVSVITESYVIDNFENYLKKIHRGSQIVIGENVWLGANSLVLPGVNISNNIIVGAGSIVTKNLECEYGIYAGNPAKLIGKIGRK